MKREPNLLCAKVGGLRSRQVLAAVVMAASLTLSGCLQPLQKQSAALQAAATPVVDQATASYQNANALHNLRIDYDAVDLFDKKDPVYDATKMTPVLLSEKDIDSRLAVLKAFQLYVANVVAITNGTSSPALDAASTSLGNSLTSAGNDLAPSVDSVLGISSSVAGSTTTTSTQVVSGNTTTTTSTTAPTAATPAISTAAGNGISAAVNALGQFLVARVVKKELPPQIVKMDPVVAQLCEALASDTDHLRSIAARDYDEIIDRQRLFILKSTTLDPESRRVEIMKLPDIVRQKRAADEQLAQLRGALVNLEMTHHALAAEAQGNNPESLKGKLGNLAAAGSNLGKFYSSLPTQ
jgi:hypothetical protein